MVRDDLEAGLTAVEPPEPDLEPVAIQADGVHPDPDVIAAVVIDLTTIDDVVSISWPILSLLAIYFTIQNALEIALVVGNVLLFNNLQTLSIVWKDNNRQGTVLAVLSLTYAASLLIFVWSQTDMGPVLARLCLLPSAPAISPATFLLAILFIDVMSRFVLEAIDVLARTWTRSPSKQARLMSILVGVSELHRELIPIRIWLDVLEEGAGMGASFGLVLRLAYLYAKSTTVMAAAAVLYRACTLLTSRAPIFGEYLTLQQADQLCPICQEPTRGPVMLPCTHVFCEQCLSIWSEHQRSCPMCRSRLSSRLDPERPRGAGYYRYGPIRVL